MAVSVESIVERRNELVVAHMDLVPGIARRVAALLPPSFELDDLIGAGYMGLLQAAQRYQPRRHGGAPFDAFARPRIHGAIVDSIRRRAYQDATCLPVEDAPEPIALPTIEAELDEQRRNARIDWHLQRLSKRDKDVLERRYQRGERVASFAKRYNVNKSGASKLHLSAVAALRSRLVG